MKHKRLCLKDVRTETVIYMAKVIASCKTGKQLENAYLWAFKRLAEWMCFDERQVRHEDFAYDWLRAIHERYDMFYPVINNAANNRAEEIRNENLL